VIQFSWFEEPSQPILREKRLEQIEQNEKWNILTKSEDHDWHLTNAS